MTFDYKRMIAVFLAFISVIMSICGALDGIINEKPAVIVDIEEKAADADIRVMSFNIRCANVGLASWSSRIGIVCETVNRALPDSVGLQEATPEWMDALEENLVLYDYVGVGRDDGDDKGEYAAIFYLKEKYDVLESGTFWLSETPDTPSFGWDADCKRVCTWAVLENRQTGQEYIHINSHFDHIGSKARENSARMILEFASLYTDIPVVFTADMNIAEGSGLYGTFESSGVLADSKYLAADTMDYQTFHDTKPSLYKGQVIDFVFVNSKFNPLVYRVVTAGIDGRYVSDHFPIYCDMSFNG